MFNQSDIARFRRYRIAATVIVAMTLTAVCQQAVSKAHSNVQRLDPAQPTVLITGSNRGIGFGFVQHYAAAGWNVIATARSPESAAELQAFAADNLCLTRGQSSIPALAGQAFGNPFPKKTWRPIPTTATA